MAKLLKDSEPLVRSAAAQSLVLMEANEYAKEVLEIMAQQDGGPYLDGGDFDELVSEQALELDNRFKILLSRMKGNLPGP